MERINKLIVEYKANPNCYPELWISGEGLTESEIAYFISETTDSVYREPDEPPTGCTCCDTEYCGLA